MSRSRWWTLAITGCVVLRMIVPLAVLVAAPTKLPLAPSYAYTPLNGDAYGYYHAVTNLYFAASSIFHGWLGAASAFLCVCLAAAGEIVRRGGRTWLAVVLWALGPSLVAGVLVHDMAGPGAGVVGWPLVWALFTLPLPILRIATTPDRAFAFGFAVSLAANGFTVIATAVVGRRLSGRRSVGLLAALLLATWPLWMSLVAGSSVFENGQWNVDVGLHLYTEPVSTALVAAALLLLTNKPIRPTTAVAAGLVLGFATVVKLTDGVIAVAAVAVVALSSAGLGGLVALGGIVAMPVLVGYWPHGYADDNDGVAVPSGGAYQWRFVHHNLTGSTIFTPWMLLLLIPPAIFGVIALRSRFARGLLVLPVVVTVAAYASYYWTAQHPRFFYVVMPAVFILEAAGIVHLLSRPLCAREPRTAS